MKISKKTIICIIGITTWAPLSLIWADTPKVQVYEEVEKGISVGLQLGPVYDFNPPVENTEIGPACGLELGFDLNRIVRIKTGFLTEYHPARGRSDTGKWLSLDYSTKLPWIGASMALMSTYRFQAYVQAAVGYRLTDPKSIDGISVAGDDSIAVMAGGGIEYYPNLRHFSFAIEAVGMYLPNTGDMVVAILPMVRFTFGFGKVKTIRPPSDRDHDGVPDKDDKCPDIWGPESNQGCPEPDTDKDGTVDRLDACPHEPGPASNSGCPKISDRDSDGVVDNVDRCPDLPGPKDQHGCPDRDNDGIPDHIDKCPDEPGTVENDGCPTKAHVKVVVTKSAIELREKIHFEFGRATILSKSYPILNQVVATLKQYPEIKKLRIEGHTDNKGSRSYNLRLSHRRAQSVVKYLINQGGIASERLVAQGFGEDKPLATNTTEAGRSKNRRVEMIILQRD